MYWKKQTDAIIQQSRLLGHIPDGLSKVVAPALKKEIVLSVKAEVTGHTRQREWTLVGRIEVPCVYIFYGPKKSKGEFRNKLRKQLDNNKLALIVSHCYFSAFRQ